MIDVCLMIIRYECFNLFQEEAPISIEQEQGLNLLNIGNLSGAKSSEINKSVFDSIKLTLLSSLSSLSSYFSFFLLSLLLAF